MTERETDLELRAIIGIRNSGRKDEAEASPAKQRQIATAIANRKGGRVIDEFRENGVSGGRSLSKRKFGDAIARCERGDADMIVWAFRSRNDRDIIEGSTAIKRMDAAGCQLWAGEERLTHKTRADWQRATMGSFFDQDYRLACKENAERQFPDWVAAGWWFGPVPPGWAKRAGGHTLEFDETYRDAIAEAFTHRLAGQPIASVQDHLADRGMPLSYRQVQNMLRQPLYKGLLAYGRNEDGTYRWENSTFYAADPIVSARAFDAVQTMVKPTGRRPKSDRLLARLGIVRCAGCDSKMVVGAQTKPNGKRYPHYTCRDQDRSCRAPATIAAELLEGHVIERAKLVIADAQERESAGREYRALTKQRDKLARQLGAAGERLVRLPAGAAYAAALAAITELQAEHDRVAAQAERLSGVGAVEVADASALDDTDPATLPDRRTIISLAVPDVIVFRGRGPVDERVSFEPLA